MTEPIPLSGLLEDPELRRQAVRVLRTGGVACFPTDTVYGLGARADADCPQERIYAIKGRPLSMPLPVLIGDPEDLMKYGHPSPRAAALARRHWPGALTVVVRGRDTLCERARQEGNVGMRCPDVDWLRGLIREIGVPLTGTSANRSGEPAARSLDELPAEVLDGCDLVIDGGRLPPSLSSTVVDLTADPPVILRQGPVAIEPG